MKKKMLLLKQLHENFRSRPPRELSHSSVMQNDALVHLKGLKGY